MVLFFLHCCVVLLTIRLQVLDCSALAPDLTLLPAGDKTQIGEQGVGFRSSCFFGGLIRLLNEMDTGINTITGQIHI